jgi:hypothetical protein
LLRFKIQPCLSVRQWRTLWLFGVDCFRILCLPAVPWLLACVFVMDSILEGLHQHLNMSVSLSVANA